MKRIILLSSAALLASGCASDSWIYPTFDAEDQRTLVNDGAKLTAVPITVDDARNMVFGLTEKLSSASRHRDDAKVIARELLFYGSLLAVGGVAASSIALRNVGAGIAAGSLALDNHYQPSVQSAAFDKAAQRMRCARGLLDPIDPALLDALPADARAQIPAETMSRYAGIPRRVSTYIEKVSLDLRAALAVVTLSAPSEQDLLASLTSYRQAQSVSDRRTSGLSKAISKTVRNARAVDERTAVALAASAASAAKVAADASSRLASSVSIQGQQSVSTELLADARKTADAAVTAAARAISAASSVSALTSPRCTLPSATNISPSTSREYRICVIQGKTPEEQGELAQAFGQAVGTFSEQMDLCLTTHQQ
ncbi:hypothetical protein [Burkholderia stagnalis]|uniref:hypothetical protein n=1 Tax=Burkholderia stagnalis TaxID=1503054 RepID=UPI000AD95CB9|nr:hypothetical protein [Burkholderia stagnalis]